MLTTSIISSPIEHRCPPFPGGSKENKIRPSEPPRYACFSLALHQTMSTAISTLSILHWTVLYVHWYTYISKSVHWSRTWSIAWSVQCAHWAWYLSMYLSICLCLSGQMSTCLYLNNPSFLSYLLAHIWITLHSYPKSSLWVLIVFLIPKSIPTFLNECPTSTTKGGRRLKHGLGGCAC